MDKKTNIIIRKRFADLIYYQMGKNKNIWVVCGDLGYKMWDKVREKFPNRFINVGAAETTMIGVAVGLALEGKIPFVYSITPFLLYRPFETIRNYLNHEKIPVKLIGSGCDRDYSLEGISHWSEEDRRVMKVFPNVKSVWYSGKENLKKIVEQMIKDKNPWYLNLPRK
jgi:transketolase